MFKMKRLFLAMLMLAVSVAQLSAQTSTDERKKEINKIKKSSAYIYAEATLPEQQAAIDLAKDMLYQNINEWVAKQKKFAGANKVVTVNTNYATENMTLPRGNMYRAFMYVKKSDIIPASNVDVTTAPEMKIGKEDKVGTSTVVPIDGVTSELLTAENTGQLTVILKKLKQEGKIAEYNKLSTLQNPDECVMVIFNGNGNVEAVLSAGASRVNLKTGAADAITNYKGRGAIGVRISK